MPDSGCLPDYHFAISYYNMLGKCPSLADSASQTSVRHQVRKLRAKVKALLPQQPCHHYRKRNQKIAHMENRKKNWASTHASESWKMGGGSGVLAQPASSGWFKQDIHSDHRPQKLHRFEELSPAEIEQINEDKFYFIGGQHLETYEEFISQTVKKLPSEGEEGALFKLKSQMSNPAISGQKRGRPSFLGWQRCSHTQQVKKHRESSVSLMLKSRRECTVASQKRIYSSANNFKTVSAHSCKDSHRLHQQRLRAVEQKNKQKALYEKIHMELKQQKGEANYRELKYQLYSKIKAKQAREVEQRQQVLKKRNILLKKGEINQMNEELRKIFIRRKEKNPSLKLD